MLLIQGSIAMLKQVTHADGSTHMRHLNGWRKQVVDPRDEPFRLKLHRAFTGTPSAWDNRRICSPVVDQGELGSCTANAFAGLVECNEIKRLAGTTTPPMLENASRLFQYYATRKIENTVDQDSGATIRDAIKAGALFGVANEKIWPYNTGAFAVEPPQNVWSAAATHKVISYHAITDGDLETMKATLHQGYLIEFGFQVYSYFMSAEMATHGILNIPQGGENPEGGHAVALAGFDDAKKAFLVRNSWGPQWGIGGYFWMSYEYVGNATLASDFWVVLSAPI